MLAHRLLSLWSKPAHKVCLGLVLCFTACHCGGLRLPQRDGTAPTPAPNSSAAGLAPLSKAAVDSHWQAPESPPANSGSRVGSSTGAIPAPVTLWWEAEAARATNFPEHHAFEPANDSERAVLSGGRWVGAQDPGKALFLDYVVSIPKAGDYQFYARKFWQHGPFRYRINEEPWSTCPKEVALLDSAAIRQWLVVNWVHAGQLHLAQGDQRLRVELCETAGSSAFDAFLLTNGDFVPRGALKPEQAYAPAPDGYQVFDPGSDTFQPTPLDLRWLNQKSAGIDGPVRARGSELIFEKSGQEVRFWGVNARHSVLSLPPALQRRYARQLSKFGVNLVRLHDAPFQAHAFHSLTAGIVEKIQSFAAVLKQEGIYLGLSVYFPLWLQLRAEDGIPGYTGQNPFGLAFFNAELANAQANWWRQLLSAVNPDTGLSLAKDPALAFVELVNEDSTLFWTFSPYELVPPAQAIELERQFGSWLTKKYGSLPGAFATWGGSAQRGDQPEAGRAGIIGQWNLANDHTLRSRDTAEFLARLMRDYYTKLQATLRNEIGYSGLTICSNWQTSDERVLGPLDNWANTSCDAMDRHAYMGGPVEGDGADYMVQKGQKYDDQSTLKEPQHAAKEPWTPLPAFVEPTYNNKPAFVSELGWPWPNRFRAEGPLAVALFGRTAGLDAPVWFASSTPFWANSLDKFEIKDPTVFGQFPAAALIFRRGLVKQPATVATYNLDERQLFELRGAPFVPVAGFDTLRKRAESVMSGSSAEQRPIDPLTLLLGPVAVSLGDAPQDGSGVSKGGTQATSLDPNLIETARKQQRITNATGEVSWDFGHGVVSLDAARVNAAFGFLGAAGQVELSEVRINLQNEYAALALVALDDEPVARSRRLLLQVSTEAVNSGWSAPGTGKRAIENAGAAPIWLRSVAGHVALKRPDAKQLRVTALDASFLPQRRAIAGADDIALLPGTLYYLIESAPESAPTTSP